MSRQQYRKEFKSILEKTFLPEGISNEEQNEKLLSQLNWVKNRPNQILNQFV